MRTAGRADVDDDEGGGGDVKVRKLLSEGEGLVEVGGAPGRMKTLRVGVGDWTMKDAMALRLSGVCWCWSEGRHRGKIEDRSTWAHPRRGLPAEREGSRPRSGASVWVVGKGWNRQEPDRDKGPR